MRISDWSSDVCSSDLGPYSVTVTKAGAGTDTEEGIYLELNSVNAVNAQLDSGDATTLETVAVTASRMLDTFNPDNKGDGTPVRGRQLELLPQGSQIGRAQCRGRESRYV